MGYTKFGEYFRILRIKNGETLNDVKDFLNVSSAYISAVELGKRPVPKNWASILQKHYNLDAKSMKEMNEAIENSKTNIKVSLEKSQTFQRELAMAFQRSFYNVSEDTADRIIKLLERGD